MQSDVRLVEKIMTFLFARTAQFSDRELTK